MVGSVKNTSTNIEKILLKLWSVDLVFFYRLNILLNNYFITVLSNIYTQILIKSQQIEIKYKNKSTTTKQIKYIYNKLKYFILNWRDCFYNFF